MHPICALYFSAFCNLEMDAIVDITSITTPLLIIVVCMKKLIGEACFTLFRRL